MYIYLAALSLSLNFFASCASSNFFNLSSFFFSSSSENKKSITYNFSKQVDKNLQDYS